jgi:uncharacterized repeat protein (TIGR04138 family)
MVEIPEHIQRLLEEDSRYNLDAYRFVHDGLVYAQEELRLGERKPSESATEAEGERVDAHLTGQQLCIVLASMGIYKTNDIGEIVYNLIRVGEMRKSKSDRKEDFDDVYDFEQVFDRDFKFEATKA